VAAPKFIPTEKTNETRGYSSPPQRIRSNDTERPGEIKTGQPKGKRLGSVGPDQGFAYKLVSAFDDRLITGKVSRKDAISGCLALAMKRAALFGRAPVIHDLTAAFTIYGFLKSDVSADLVKKREELFPEVSNSHHYSERRDLVDQVSDSFLKKSHTEIKDACDRDWSAPF